MWRKAEEPYEWESLPGDFSSGDIRQLSEDYWTKEESKAYEERLRRKIPLGFSPPLPLNPESEGNETR